MMNNRRFWTFDTLVGAFLDLFIAYFLLCGSTIAFIAVKFLAFFGLSLPPPANGLFGNPNSNFRALLVDYPTDKVSSVQYSVTRNFPFDSVFFRPQICNLNEEVNNNGNGFRELEGEGSCESKSGNRRYRSGDDDNGIRVDKERGFDVKGKGALNYRLRGGFRRRRKAAFDNGKYSASPNWVTCVDQLSNNDNDNDNDSGGLDGSSSVLSGANNSNYEGETPLGVKSDSKYDEGIVFGDLQKMIPVDEADKDKMIIELTRELEESQVARAGLYVELEKERNAAATAADEAMSMILRLQEEKASIEMEAHQYQRMIEEKSAYDEEEMNILKEIVLRREREKHFLEKEVDVYRQMIRVENDQFNSGNNDDFIQDHDLMLQQLSMNISEKKSSRLVEDVDFIKQEEPERTIDIVEEEKGLETNASRDGETNSRVYDVHVIDNESKSTGEKKQVDRKQGCSEVSAGLPPVSGSKSSLRRNSTSALDNERTKLDTEVEWLRERLRVVQEGREKLNFSVDNREKEGLQLQLLEDIARQLQEIRMLTEPRTARQASLPLPSSKGSTKKKRCRSVSSSGHAQSS